MLLIGKRGYIGKRNPTEWEGAAGAAAVASRAKYYNLNRFGRRSAGGALLGTEPDGMAIDFVAPTPHMLIRDNGRVLNYSGAPFAAGGINGDAGKLSFTRASLAMKYNSAGTLEYSGHNLCLQSQTLTSATWNSGQGVTAAADQTTAPDGTLTADKVTCDSSNGLHYLAQSFTWRTRTYRVSWYVKYINYAYMNLGVWHGDSNNFATFNIQNGTVDTTGSSVISTSITSVGDGWYRCSVVVPVNATSTTYAVAFGKTGTLDNTFTGTGVEAMYAWGGQVNELPCSDTNYYPTVASAVYTARYDYNPSSLAARGLLVEEQRTNLCLWSSDFTNAAWVKTTMTAAKTATGPDGLTNSASTLTASAGNATALQAITSGSAARISSMFVKRRTGSGTINITQDNGTTWTPVTVTANWTRVELPAATLANPTVGVQIVTNADAIDVAFFQHEVGSFVTSAIPTTSASVTRAADDISIATSLFPYSATVGTLYASCMFMSVAALARALNLDDGTANERVTLGIDASAAGLLNVVDGGTEQAGASGITSGTFVALTAAKIAAAWAANDLALTKDAAAPTTDASATLPTMTTLRLGSGPSNAAPINGWIQKAVHIPLRKSNADLQRLTI